MTSQFKNFSDDGSRDPRPAPSWPTAPGDPDETALREGWSALGQLLDKSGAGRIDLAGSARLVREVERRVRRRKQMQWGAMAAAAVVLVALSFAWRPFRNGDERQIAEKPPLVRPLAALTSTKLKSTSTAAIRPTATPSATAAALTTVVDVAFDAPPYWHDSLDDDLESARAYAGEVEHSWRRRGDRWAGLRDQMEQLQAELNESPL